MSPRRPRTPRPRRARGAAESAGSIVLGFESVVVFLAGLVVYGLKALPAGVADWWGVVGGAVLAVLMILTARYVGTRAGVIAGWALQVVLLAAGLLVPAIVVVAILFGGMWGYATIKGAQLDRRNAAARAALEDPDTPAQTDPENGAAT